MGAVSHPMNTGWLNVRGGPTIPAGTVGGCKSPGKVEQRLYGEL